MAMVHVRGMHGWGCVCGHGACQGHVWLGVCMAGGHACCDNVATEMTGVDGHILFINIMLNHPIRRT